MLDWLKQRSEIEVLKVKYTNLMKKSYQLALRDKEASDRVHDEAEKLYQKIKELQSNS
jgi:hypothetical protein